MNIKMNIIQFFLTIINKIYYNNYYFIFIAAAKPARMTMLFGGKKTSANANYQVNQGTANKGTYIPEGLTKAQYEAQLKKEAEDKKKKASKFKIGKEPETLTEWVLKCEAKGLKGKDMLLGGHRMVKAKYAEFYTDESPV